MKQKKTLGNIFLLIISILICFLVVELTVRVLHITPPYGYPQGMYQNDELLDYKLTPYISGTVIKQEFQTPFFTNSLGMHDIEYKDKKVNDYRILAVGDSFVWGAYGTKLEETFLKILEKRLNDNSKNTNFQVMNAGVPGYGTDQETLYVKNRSNYLNPDTILLHFYINNDFFDNLEKGEHTVNEDGQLVREKKKIYSLMSFRNFLLDKFHSYRLIERGAVTIFAKLVKENIALKSSFTDDHIKLYSIKPSKEDLKTVAITYRTLNELLAYTNSENLNLVIVIIPAKYQVENNLWEEIISRNNLKKEQYDVKMPQRYIINWGNRNNITIIDLLPRLKNIDEQVYWDLNPHFNRRGNEKVAEIIYEEFSKQKNIKRMLQKE